MPKKPRPEAGRRLSCSANILGDLVIDIPPKCGGQNAQVCAQADSDRPRHRAQPGIPRLLAMSNRRSPTLPQPLGAFDRLLIAIERADWGFQKACRSTPILLGEVAKDPAQGRLEITRRDPEQSRAARQRWAGALSGPEERSLRGFGLPTLFKPTIRQASVVACCPGRTLASSGTSNPQIPLRRKILMSALLCD